MKNLYSLQKFSFFRTAKTVALFLGMCFACSMAQAQGNSETTDHVIIVQGLTTAAYQSGKKALSSTPGIIVMGYCERENALLLRVQQFAFASTMSEDDRKMLGYQGLNNETDQTILNNELMNRIKIAFPKFEAHPKGGSMTEVMTNCAEFTK